MDSLLVSFLSGLYSRISGLDSIISCSVCGLLISNSVSHYRLISHSLFFFLDFQNNNKKLTNFRIFEGWSSESSKGSLKCISFSIFTSAVYRQKMVRGSISIK